MAASKSKNTGRSGKGTKNTRNAKKADGYGAGSR